MRRIDRFAALASAVLLLGACRRDDGAADAWRRA